MRIHLGKKDHKCPHCDYSSVRKDNLKSHMKTHDKNNDQSTTRKRTTPTSDLPALLNYKRFKSSRFTNVDKNGNERNNHLTIHNNYGISHAPNRFYPQISSSFNGNLFQQQYAFAKKANIIKQRQCEEAFVKSSEKITDITEKQPSCTFERNGEGKTVNRQQQLSTVTGNSKNKLVDLFRPYQDMITKGC